MSITAQDSLIGRWLVNGSLRDWSGHGNHGILTPGNGGFRRTEKGLAMLFDGADTKIDTGADMIGVGACSVSAWIHPDDLGNNTSPKIIDNGKFSFIWFHTNQNLKAKSDGSTQIASPINSVLLNKWSHVVFTRDATGASSNLYVNGVLSGTANRDTGTPVAGDYNVLIGNDSIQMLSFDGKILDTRIYNKVLSLSEVQSIYREGLETLIPIVKAKRFFYPDPKSIPQRSVAYSMRKVGNRIEDISGHGSHGTAHNMVEDVPGVIGRACRFRAARQSYIDCGNGDNVRITGTKLTVSAWIKRPVGSGQGDNYWGVLGKSGTNKYRSAYAFIIHDNTSLWFYINYVSSWAALAPLCCDDQWHHVLATYDGSQIRIWVDLVEGTPKSCSGDIIDTEQSFEIGRQASSYCNACIDEVEVENRVWSEEEMRNVYLRGAAKLLFYDDFSDTPADGIGRVPRGWSQLRDPLYCEMDGGYPPPLLSGHEILPKVTSGELITNGGFAADSGWSKGTGWSISDGKATHTGQNDGTLSQDVGGVAGRKYRLSVDLVGANPPPTNNYVNVYAGGVELRCLVLRLNKYSWLRGNITYTIDFIWAGADSTLRFISPNYATHYLEGSIDNVMLEEVESELPVLTRYAQAYSGIYFIGFPSEQAYGTWEFDVNLGMSNFQLYLMGSALGNEVTSGYLLRLNSSGCLHFDRVVDGAGSRIFENAVMRPDGSYIPTIPWGTWGRLKITRNYKGVWHIYLNGELVVSTGAYTNPFTDNTIKTSKYFLWATSSIMHRMTNLKLTRGIV